MEEIKRLTNSRKGYRIHLKKLLAKAADIIKRQRDKSTELSDLPSLTDMRHLRDQLRRKDELISTLDAEILKHIKDEEEIATEVCEAEDIKESIATSIAHIEQIIATHVATTVGESIPITAHPHIMSQSRASTEPTSVATESTADHTVEHTPPTNVEKPPPPSDAPPSISHGAPPSLVSASHDITRLPKLSIQMFSGDTLQWQSFWDCFEAAVHRNRSITGVQKLSYLRAQLQGNALRVIAGLPLINDNYDHSVTLLKERYGEPHKLIDAHMQALIELKCRSNTLSALQVFYDSVEGHIRSLQSLGTPQEHYGSMLVPTILRKLPADVRRNLARSHDSEQWTLKELQRCILQEVRILEMGMDYSPNQSNAHTPTGAFVGKLERKQSQKSSNAQITKKCTFCKSNSHPTSKCDIIKDSQQRIEVVKTENLCFNCLGHHKVSQCTSKYRCKVCRRKHHTSLCDVNASTKPQSQPERDSATATTTTTAETKTSFLIPVSSDSTHNLTSPTGTKCLLKTAIADVRAGPHRYK